MDGSDLGGLFVGNLQCQYLDFLLGLDSPEKSLSGSCLGDKGQAAQFWELSG